MHVFVYEGMCVEYSFERKFLQADVNRKTICVDYCLTPLLPYTHTLFFPSTSGMNSF